MVHRTAIFMVLLLISGCSSDNLVTDRNTRIKIRTDFSQRNDIPLKKAEELKLLLTENTNGKLSESLHFLYAYMPLNDLADYSPSFFYENSLVALKAKKEMKWGARVPAEIFLHYVLPVRVNNENLDNFRVVCYDELKNRVANMEIADAALEINRWCHEKVSYQSSDIRTSAPLSTILSARGRCGEESTLTVAALRTVGIPARQVYTPRWAHCDDNHAWVEVWIDNEWYYMGACEPEPVLDRGWFTEPARRAMLVHTKAFGSYSGSENVIRNEKRFAEINNLSKYAITREITVRVLDESGNPAHDIDVQYCLYNYAEFYPIATVKTDNHGYSRFETGLGDLLIWTGVGDRYDYEIVQVASTDTLLLKLDKTPDRKGYIEANLSVPVVPEPLPPPSPELMEMNRKANISGDSIRKAYISSWVTRDSATRFATVRGYHNPSVIDLIIRSQGNFSEIMAFLTQNSDKKELAVELLSHISEKDLRDTREEILSDHLNNSVKYSEVPAGNNSDLYYTYVLNPRVANENLIAWRAPLSGKFERFRRMFAEDQSSVAEIVQILAGMIALNDADNYYGTPITPLGVMELQIADNWSRKIFMVAALRSVGIPSRLEPGTDRPQYYLKENWTDIWFPDEKIISEERATVSFVYDGAIPEPEYYIHFTLARYDDGKYHTLNYDYNKKVSTFNRETSVLPGHYMLVTGNRIDDSNILVALKFFELSAGENEVIDVSPRKDTSQYETLGKLSVSTINELRSGSKPQLEKGAVTGGNITVWLNPETEPGKHLIGDLIRYKADFENWEGSIVIFAADDALFNKLESIRNSIPAGTTLAVDDDFELMRNLLADVEEAGTMELPFVLLTDEEGRISYISSGYKIGIAGQLIKRIHNK